MLRCQPQAIAKKTRNGTGKYASEGSYLPSTEPIIGGCGAYPRRQAGRESQGLLPSTETLSGSSDTIGRCDEAC